MNERRKLESDVSLEAGDVVAVSKSYEGGEHKWYRGTVVNVKPSGTVIVDDERETDGAGTPIRHYVSTGTVTLITKKAEAWDVDPDAEEFVAELDATDPAELPEVEGIVVKVKEENGPGGWPVVEIRGERERVLAFVEANWGTETVEYLTGEESGR